MSRSGTGSPSAEEPKPEPILLKIKIKDQHEGEMEFRIKATTKMSKVFDNYCKRREIDRKTHRFLFEGYRIQDNDTAATLELEDEDMIQCVLEQTGGEGTPEANAGGEGGAGDGATAEGESKPQDDGRLDVKVVDQDLQEVFFKIKRKTPLLKVMNAYCERQGKDRRMVRFLFEGSRVQDNDTPDSLEMESGDSIEVVLEQLGGEGSEAGDAEPDPAQKHIEIKVQAPDGTETAFKLKKITPLKRLMDAFASKLGVAPDSLRFYDPDGMRIVSDATPDSLALEPGDTITTQLEQLGGVSSGEGSQDGDDEPVQKHIEIKVRDDSGQETEFKLKKTTPFKKLIDAYAKEHGKEPNSMRFYNSEATRINPDDTPDSLDLENGDLIDVHIEQLGGDALPNPAENHIEITVRDDYDYETAFRMKKTTRMKVLMVAYVKRHGKALDSVRFFHPEGILLHSDDTPKSLELSNGDLISSISVG